jgi:hypothetical protein
VKVRERLPVSNKKLNDMKVKERYHVKISNRFAALGNFDDDDDDISSICQSIRI